MQRPILYNYKELHYSFLNYFFEMNFAILPSDPVSNIWKKFLLTLRGSKIGKGVKFGRNLWVDDYSKLTIGDYAFFNFGCMFLSGGKIHIGTRVLLGPGVTILSASHDTQGTVSMRTSQRILGPVHIEREAWLAAKSTILPGVTVGEGAVVAAGSVVTKDVEPYTVVAGNPARFLRVR